MTTQKPLSETWVEDYIHENADGQTFIDDDELSDKIRALETALREAAVIIHEGVEGLNEDYRQELLTKLRRLV